MDLKKNDILKLRIVSMSSEGVGIGRTNDNIVVFVPNSAIGDLLNVKILKTKKNLAYAKIEEIIEQSVDRITSDCEVCEKCGGCVYRHMSYDAELLIKRQKVIDAITRIGKLDPHIVGEIVSTGIINGYRNKAQIPVDVINNEVKMGFYSKHSHRIVDCVECKLSPPIFNLIANDVRNFLSKYKEIVYNETTHTGIFRHLYLRYAQNTNQVMVCFVCTKNRIPHVDEILELLLSKYNNIKSVLINVNSEDTNVILGKKNVLLYGNEYIVDELCGLKFRISAHSFYQVNHDAAERLYHLVKSFSDLSDEDVVLDLFCGTGTIGMTLADSSKEVFGVEIVKQAIIDANKNKEINNIKNARYICKDATLISEQINCDVLIIDPPRKGLISKIIETIISISPRRIIYVSCNVSTLARDLIGLSSYYKIESIIPVDMFPRTSHVETCVLLVKENINDDEVISIKLDLQGLKVPQGEYIAPEKPTYGNIKKWIKDIYGFNVSSLYIAQIKDKLGFEKRDNYNQGEGKSKVPVCPKEKEDAIMDAFKHFGLI